MRRQSREEIQDQIMQEALMDDTPVKRPHPFLVIMLTLIVLLVLVLMVVPYYGIRLDPRPTNVPNASILSQFNFTNHPPAGNLRTIRLLIASSDPQIKQLADMIVRQSCDGDSDVCYAKALFLFVQRNIQYVPDPMFTEYIQHPYETLRTRTGDCDDYAVLFASLSRAVGIPTRIVMTSTHMFDKIYLDDAPRYYKDSDGWIFVDPTCSDCAFGQLAPSIASQNMTYLSP